MLWVFEGPGAERVVFGASKRKQVPLFPLPGPSLPILPRASAPFAFLPLFLSVLLLHSSSATLIMWLIVFSTFK